MSSASGAKAVSGIECAAIVGVSPPSVENVSLAP
jgi:hypothetical protein